MQIVFAVVFALLDKGRPILSPFKSESDIIKPPFSTIQSPHIDIWAYFDVFEPQRRYYQHRANELSESVKFSGQLTALVDLIISFVVEYAANTCWSSAGGDQPVYFIWEPIKFILFLDVCKLCFICCMTFQQFSYYIFKMKITVSVKLMRKIEFEICYIVILGTQSSDGFSLCMCDSVSTLPDVVA